MTSRGSSKAPPPHLHGIRARRHRERRLWDGAELRGAAPGAGGQHRYQAAGRGGAGGGGARVPLVTAALRPQPWANRRSCGCWAAPSPPGSGRQSRWRAGGRWRRARRRAVISCSGCTATRRAGPSPFRPSRAWVACRRSSSGRRVPCGSPSAPCTATGAGRGGPVRVRCRCGCVSPPPPPARRYVFAKSLFEGGQLDALEWAVYQEWHTFLVGQLGARTAPHAFLYLRASPQRCLERLRCRARPEERDVTLRYLQQLHVQHERWLLERSAEVHFAEVRHAPVLVLDVEGDFEHDAAAQDTLMARVEDFVKVLRDGAPHSTPSPNEPRGHEDGHTAGTAAGP